MRVDTIVGVSLEELIEVNMEGFNNLLEERVIDDYYGEDAYYKYVLEDISYEYVPVGLSDIIHIRVNAELKSTRD